MEAKKCDMCKKFYDETEGERQRARLYLLSVNGQSEKRVDLCQECHDKIFNMIAKEVR